MRGLQGTNSITTIVVKGVERFSVRNQAHKEKLREEILSFMRFYSATSYKAQHLSEKGNDKL